MTRIYMPRANGGRGLVNIANQYKNSIIKFICYTQNILQYVSNQQFERGQNSIHNKDTKYCQ